LARRKTVAKEPPHRVGDACAALERLAPARLAQSWDNVGLLAGDVAAPLGSVLCCIDLTPAVADEAISGRYALVVAYHPPWFKPISRLRPDAAGAEGAVFRCITAGVAVYSPHTALDAAAGGTNDVLADVCGMVNPQPIEYVESDRRRFKLVTFVPQRNLDEVGGALFQAGAGVIGNYTHCSYRLMGLGTFMGNEATHPAVGRRGRLEQVEEVRIEMVVSASRLPGVVAALRKAHPYEEPAFDIYPLSPPPDAGIGRQGRLAKPTTLSALAKRLKKSLAARHVQVVGAMDHDVNRAVIVVGSAGSLPLSAKLDEHTVIVSGEIHHHDALSFLRGGSSAIALGHWTSERPVLASLAKRLSELLPNAKVEVSRTDVEPFQTV